MDICAAKRSLGSLMGLRPCQTQFLIQASAVVVKFIHDFTLQWCAQVREYLEKHYTETSGRDTMKLAIKALSETVEASSKNVEIAVVDRASGLKFLSDAEVDSIVSDIESEKTAADAARKQRAAEASGSAGTS